MSTPFIDFSTIPGIVQRTGCTEQAAKKFRATFLRQQDSNSLHYIVAGHSLDGVDLTEENAQATATRLARFSKKCRQ